MGKVRFIYRERKKEREREQTSKKGRNQHKVNIREENRRKIS